MSVRVLGLVEALDSECAEEGCEGVPTVRLRTPIGLLDFCDAHAEAAVDQNVGINAKTRGERDG